MAAENGKNDQQYSTAIQIGGFRTILPPKTVVNGRVKGYWVLWSILWQKNHKRYIFQAYQYFRTWQKTICLHQNGSQQCHSQPQTRQTPDTSNPRHTWPRHFKPIRYQTSDKEYGAVNYNTDKNAFFVIRLCFLYYLILFVSNCFKKCMILAGHITLTL